MNVLFRVELTDAPTPRDPTGTSRLRARMRAEGDRRWQVLGQTLRKALIEHDLIGLRGVSHMQGDKTEGFAKWIGEELRQKVFGLDGRWLKPYVHQAAALAQTRATGLIGTHDAYDPDEPRDPHGHWTVGGGDAWDDAKESGLPTAAHDPAQPTYLRIGQWNPDNEKSKNFATGDIEAGLSVYDLHSQTGQPIVPPEGEWAEDDLRDRLRGDDSKFLVQGEHVGIGNDGEPLLQNMRVVGTYNHRTTRDANPNHDPQTGQFASGGGTYISAHRSGNTIWLDMMEVPSQQRGKGVGSSYYQNWEQNLPKDVKLVQLMAADTGEGKSNTFWEKMGFEYKYDGENLSYEDSQTMWKGVNGHPTPKSIEDTAILARADAKQAAGMAQTRAIGLIGTHDANPNHDPKTGQFSSGDDDDEIAKDVFHIPADKLDYYDTSESGGGDEGWSKSELLESIKTEGMKNPVEVGRSKVEMAKGNHTVFVFNGNHRLQAAKQAGLKTIPAVNSDADDAVPLTRGHVRELGGVVLDQSAIDTIVNFARFVDWYISVDAVDPDRVTTMENLAVSELQGICGVAQQQLTRCITHCLMAGSSPTRTANAASGVTRNMRMRTQAMAEFIVSKTHATSTLSAFRNAGVTYVGTIPERLRKRKMMDRDVDLEEVEVLTAGDDDVCFICEDISDGGPYDLDEAEDLIPAHIKCRCGFVPASDARFASVHDYSPDQPRGASAPGHSSGEFAAITSHELLQRPAEKKGSKNIGVIARQLDNRSQEILRGLGVRGGKLTVDNRTEATDALLAHAITLETKAELEKSGNAQNWYTHKVDEAVKIFAMMDHPEVLHDPVARTAFALGLSVTSQGEVVTRSAELTDQVYEKFHATGRMPTDVVAKDAAVMNGNFDKFNTLMDKMGPAGAVNFLKSEMTVRELEKQGWKISDLPKDVVVYGSAIFGPKIGNGFLQNLMGNFKPTTQDMWLMRTWGRLTGTLKDITTTKKGVDDQYENFVKGLKADGQKNIPTNRNALNGLAEKIYTQHERDYRKYKDEYKSGERVKSATVRAAERIHVRLNGVNDDPGSGASRLWREKVLAQSRDELSKEGINLTAADHQATLWYPEKTLWEHLGSRGVRDGLADYSSAFRALAIKKGYTHEQINKAIMKDAMSEPIGYAPWLSDPDVVEVMTHAEIERAATNAANYMRLHAFDFDPSELRDPTGKWTTGGGAVEGFVSPNVASGVNFEQATKALASEPQRQLTEISSYIDDKLGIHGSNTNVVGAWADGAENSIMMVAPGASPDAMRVAMAMKGYLANQKSVLMFQPHEDGNHMMISFPQTGSLADIHAGLLQNKVWFHTLEPTDHGATVHVFASDQATVNAVGKAAGNAPVEFVRGHGEFIPDETISKRRASEERAVARRGYEKVIAAADRSHALAGQDVGKIWQDVRDRWQSISATQG